MPFLSTDKFGAGPLYNFSSTDPNAYLTQGTTYFQTSGASWAIQQDVFDSTFVLAGEIGSNGIGIRVTTNDGSRIDVTSTGYISADGDAIYIRSTGAFFLTNSGTIVSNHDAIFVDDIPGSRLLLTNTGIIQGKSFVAIVGASGVESITNTGQIVGDVQLLGGADRFDTHLGVLTGIVYGGDGDDSYMIAGTERISENPGSGLDGVTSYGDYALPANVENLTLVSSASRGWGNREENTIKASDRDCVLAGRDGDDTLYGFNGDDVLKGGRGDDSVQDYSGDNQLFGGAGDDSLSAYSGDNRFDGGTGDDLIYQSPGSDSIEGGVGHDRLSYASSASGVMVNLATGAGSGGDAEGDTISGIEDLDGSNGADRLTGNNSDNILTGGLGFDALNGGGGNDILRGGLGADALNGGGGVDTADYSDANVAVTIDLVAGTGSGDTATGDTLVSIENVIGSFSADTITGSGADNLLQGRGGADILRGGAGDDTLVGGSGNDTLYGQGGADVFGFSDVSVGTPGGWDDDTINGFQNGIDKISFVGASAIHSIADLTLSTSSGNTIISTSGGADVIVLVGFSPADLDSSDFIFDPAAAVIHEGRPPPEPMPDLAMLV